MNDLGGRGFWTFVAVCVLAIVAILAHSYLTYQAVSRVEAPASARAMPTTRLTSISSSFVESASGPAPRALDDPLFADADLASELLRPGETVYVVEAPEGVLVFPQAVMRAHNVINTSVGGRPAVMTYSPETQSAVGFWSSFAGMTTTFEPTEMLVNGNLILRDRATGSSWPQLLGVATRGHLSGVVLGRIPVYPTTWERVVRMYPEALVLTGLPGVPNADDETSSKVPSFASSQEPKGIDNRLPLGEPVVGVALAEESGAIPVKAVAVRHCVPFQVGTTRLIAVYDVKLGVVRLFDRDIGGSALVLEPVNGVVVDTGTRSVWDDRGRCVSGALRGVALKPVDSVFCPWFAWVAFFPDTAVFR